MSRTEAWPWLLFGGIVAGGGLLAWALPSVPPGSSRSPQPPAPSKEDSGFTDLDVEAAARMLASENPGGSERLHIEQIWAQLRARKRGESLFDRITAGSGWGPQGERAYGGRARPVATTEPATADTRRLAREVLEGRHASILPGARKFFEPVVQDRAFALAEQARKKQRAGQPLSAQEKRLLGYKRTANQVRTAWTQEGARLVGSVGDLEFYT